MKKILLTSAAALSVFAANAQTIVKDSVLLGAGYAKQVWYDLENDEQGNAPKGDWDIAFNLKDLSSCVLVNTVGGASLWGFPKADKAGWAGSVDTNGLSTWPKRYNSDTSWALGAMGNYADPGNGFDLDWGLYDLTTHQVHADSFYIVKLGNGSYKKLMIESLISGTFTFKYADIDGNNEQSQTIKKTDYPNKNFAYYSIQNGAALNREPDAAHWDLLFTQYTDMSMVYTVTGVLNNRNVRVAEVKNIADEEKYNDWNQTYTTPINVIGYDWKKYDMPTSSYKVQDSLLYFVKTPNGAIWKMIFTGFASTDGKFVFSKQQLVASGINDANTGAQQATIALYPNPSVRQAVTVVYNFETTYRNAMLSVYDMSGRVAYRNVLQTQPGLHQEVLPAGMLSSGNYIVTIDTDNGRMQQKLVVQ